MKMEQTECSATLAYKIQMPGNYQEESIQQNLSSSLAFSIPLSPVLKKKKNNLVIYRITVTEVYT